MHHPQAQPRGQEDVQPEADVSLDTLGPGPANGGFGFHPGAPGSPPRESASVGGTCDLSLTLELTVATGREGHHRDPGGRGTLGTDTDSSPPSLEASQERL